MIWLVRLHGAAESRALSRTQLSRLETLHNSWLRLITRDIVGSPDSISTKDLMEKIHQLPISVMIKERRWRWLGHAARRADNNINNFFLQQGYPDMRHAQPVGRPCGTWMHYAMGDKGHESANGVWFPQPRMELAERSHEQTYLG